MQNVSEIIDGLGGNTRFAELFGKKQTTASEMRRRKSIPVEYWPRLVEVAHARGIALDYETLVKIHAEQPKEAAE